MTDKHPFETEGGRHYLRVLKAMNGGEYPAVIRKSKIFRCQRPPFGWYCTDIIGHENPTCPTKPHWWAHPIYAWRYR